MSDNIKELIEKYSNQAKIAINCDKVYKDECVYTYDNPESENGLFVCLNTFIGVSKELLPIHFSKTQSHLYLNIKTWRKKVNENDSNDDEPQKKRPTKFGIGVDGGFNVNENNFFFDNHYSIYIYPEEKFAKLMGDNSENFLTENVRNSVESIIKAESITLKEKLASEQATWDGEKRFVSKHSSNLAQLPNSGQISPDPSSWKCEVCGLTKNLWLCLTDGKILCGRRQLDGSGGNNHAVEHFFKTKYPLAVKLGTITSKGADVYSYDEDDMVEDSNLAIHLAHFGINMSKMEKTDKTMTELEIDLNQKIGEWDRIQEAGSKLVPVYGPGFTGIRNLGNSCYMNSVLQVIFTLPDFCEKYFKNRDAYLKKSSIDPSNDFNFQMSKVAYGILSGRYSQDLSKVENKNNIFPPPKGIKPNSFKLLIGKGHVEFSTKRQQDSHEFLIYLLNLLEKNLRVDCSGQFDLNPVDEFRFKLEDRIECSVSHQVRYKTREEFCLSLPISKDAAINKDKLIEFEKRKNELERQGKKLEPGDIVRPEIPLKECLKLFLQNEVIDDFYSSATNSQVKAFKSTRLATFPDYLLIQAKKFEHAADWSPIKLDISLQVPDILDISNLRGVGLKNGEKELSDELSNEEENIKLNENIISQLMDMGFSLEGSKRAAYNTRDSSDPEAAVNWAVTHMEDADFNRPFKIANIQPANNINSYEKKKTYDEESICSLISFGFTRQQAMKALDATNNNLERAADWIFSHANEIMDTNESPIISPACQNIEKIYRDGNGTYKLVSFISHMGSNANVGHYVAHILKNEKWIIFNDENVSLSENPPKDLAYLYFYKRV